MSEIQEAARYFVEYGRNVREVSEAMFHSIRENADVRKWEQSAALTASAPASAPEPVEREGLDKWFADLLQERDKAVRDGYMPSAAMRLIEARQLLAALRPALPEPKEPTSVLRQPTVGFCQVCRNDRPCDHEKLPTPEVQHPTEGEE